MNIALIAQAGIFEPLNKLLHRWFAKRPAAAWTNVSPVVSRSQFAPNSVASYVDSTRAIAEKYHKAQPLRVIHLVEAGQPRASTGRMVISGRMADVCAELDRLVAREAALS
ncbi:hypothetical protein [Candidatus Aalborgicola defluviihabitans]|uniref:hypothetical protein n=1 Tax=Candidatus Aalborgicola defluviihabitans TaxID=3386187 RepID=UPI001ED6CD46|nr:hypothetical protein [Burkholderiales bacterium]MBK7282809.1 hypothetical protein [Burkholderiales bacterium]